MRTIHFIALVVMVITLNACSVAKKFPNINSSKIQNDIAEMIRLLKEAPDDPKIFDDVLPSQTPACPTISEPFWIIPSPFLPKEITCQNSNNNVSICIFDRRLYLAFRTGPYHFASKKTGMYVISTSDLITWKKEFEIFNGKDVREPYLIAIHDTLHFYYFISGTKMTSFKPDRINHFVLNNNLWVKQPDVLEKTEVLWEFKKRSNTAYLTSYAGEHYKLKGESRVRLNFKHTMDGYTFLPADSSQIVYQGGVSECAFEFDKEGNIWAVTRLEDGDSNGFGSQLAFASKDSLQNWTFF